MGRLLHHPLLHQRGQTLLLLLLANRAFYLSEEERTRFVERMWRVAYFSCVDVRCFRLQRRKQGML